MGEDRGSRSYANLLATSRGAHLVTAGGSEKPMSVPSGARTYATSRPHGNRLGKRSRNVAREKSDLDTSRPPVGWPLIPIRHQLLAQRMGSNGQRGPTCLQFGESQGFVEK